MGRESVSPSSIRRDGSTRRSIIFEPTSDDEDTAVTINKIATYLQEVEARQAQLASQGEGHQHVTTHTHVTSTVVEASVGRDDLQRQVVDLRQALRGKDAEIAQMRSTLDSEREAARRTAALRQAELDHLREELNVAESKLVSTHINSTPPGSVPKPEHDRLQAEYNNLLHSSLALQREAAQLRTDLLEQQSREGRDERTRHREERWDAAKAHRIEVETLQQRIDNQKDEHQSQVAKLHKAAEEDRQELLRRLSGSVPSEDHRAVKDRLAHRESELRKLKRKYEDLVEDTKGLVSADVLAAAEDELSHRCRDLHHVGEQCHALEAKCAKQADELSRLRLSQSELQGHVTRLQSLHAQLDSEHSALLQRTHSDRQDLESLRDKHELLTHYHQEKERAIEQLQRDCESASRSEGERAAAVETMRRDKTQLEERLEDVKGAAGELRTKVEEERRATEAVRQRVSVLETELDTQTSKMVSMQKERRAEQDAAAHQLHGSQEQAHLLTVELDKATSELSRTRQDLKDVLVERERLSATVGDTEHRLQQLRDQHDAAARRVSQAEDHSAQLQSKLKSCNDTLKQAQERIKSYEKHFEEYVRPAVAHAKQIGLM